MGASKNQFFPKNQNNTALLCKALSHPARVAMVEHLVAVNRCIGDDFQGFIPLSQPSISRHLKVLIAADLISCSFENNSYTYEIHPVALQLLHSYFDAITSNYTFTS